MIENRHPQLTSTTGVKQARRALLALTTDTLDPQTPNFSTLLANLLAVGCEPSPGLCSHEGITEVLARTQRD